MPKYYKLVHYNDGNVDVVTDSQFGGDDRMITSKSARSISTHQEPVSVLSRSESDTKIIAPSEDRRKRLQTVGQASSTIPKIKESEPTTKEMPGVKKWDVKKPTEYSDQEHKTASELFQMQAIAYKTNKTPSAQKYNIIKMYFENAKIGPDEEKELREDLDFGETRYDLIVANATKFDENGHFVGTMQPKNSSEWVPIKTNADWASLMMSLPEERAFVNAVGRWLENTANFTEEKRQQRLKNISVWCKQELERAQRCEPPCDLAGKSCRIKKEFTK